MIIQRWLAPIQPNAETLMGILLREGLEPQRETFEPNSKIVEHRHPFGEVRYVIEGELLVNISGNQVLLRPGDRIEVPSNTKHFYLANGNSACVSVFAMKAI